MLDTDKVVRHLIITPMSQGPICNAFFKCYSFSFSGNLYLEVFDHQVHTEMNTFARLDSSNGSATSFEFLPAALEIRDLWQQKTIRQKRASLKL